MPGQGTKQESQLAVMAQDAGAFAKGLKGLSLFEEGMGSSNLLRQMMQQQMQQQQPEEDEEEDMPFSTGDPELDFTLAEALLQQLE